MNREYGIVRIYEIVSFSVSILTIGIYLAVSP